MLVLSYFFALLLLQMQMPVSTMTTTSMQITKCPAKASISPPMFGISKLSRVTLVLFGRFSSASFIAVTDIREPPIPLVVALKISAGVYSRVSFKRLRPAEYSIPDERAYEGNTFMTMLIKSA